MARTLRVLTWTMGVACVAIGFFHILLGNAAMPGIADAGPTVGSFGRFMGAVFAGYGAAWIQAARQTPVPARTVRWLAAVLLLGGLARVLSLAVDGRPHGFQLVLMVIELGLAPVYLLLADADERAHSSARRGIDGTGVQATGV
ncbi:DUF4345 domain-containing protein [Kitasatospora xanthocidica]|uniref:DUF4345 domain-containing protein n=1 Tax=Kitasatospora xanthocidica TaxID=83382 RepID=UPI001672AD76|nr:DUF4345 domain-containing protein [Kitasatospora xanthocidica]